MPRVLLLVFVLAAAVALALAPASAPRSAAPISEIVSAALDGGGAVSLTAGEGDGDALAVRAPDGRIAYVRTVRLGYPELHVMNEDGSGKRVLARASSEALAPPAWSPTGRELAFHTWDESGCLPGSRNCAQAGVAVVDPATGAVRVVSRTGDRGAGAFSWAPGGKRLAYAGQLDFDLNARTVEVVRADGGGRRVLARFRTGHVSEVAWAPRGDRIAYVREGWIWSVRAGGGTPARLARGSAPRWSPRGDRLLYTGAGGLRVLDPVSRRSRTLVRGQAGLATWSPDGRRVAYAAPAGARSRLVVVGAAGGGAVARLDPGAAVSSLFFSRDGARLVYVAWRTQ